MARLEDISDPRHQSYIRYLSRVLLATRILSAIYYALEAKLVLADNIVVSVMTEFVENKDGEWEKQDCERKACKRLMKRLKEMFPNLRICIGADSLYANKPFFQACEEYHWRYIVRFKEGSIPTVAQECEAL